MADSAAVLDRLHPLVKDLDKSGRWKTVNSYHLHVGNCAGVPTKGRPSDRAATILAAAGADWREDRR